MAIARAVANNTANAGATLAGTVAIPAGVTPGTLLIAATFLQGTTPGLAAAPVGWSPIPGVTLPVAGSGGAVMWAWYRLYQAGDADPTWTFSGTGPQWGAVCLAYTGVDPSRPVGAAEGVGSAASGTTPTVPNIRTGRANSTVVNVLGIGSGSATITANPVGYTVWPVSSGTKATFGNDISMGAAGSSPGATTYTISGSNPWISLSLELLDAASAVAQADEIFLIPEAQAGPSLSSGVAAWAAGAYQSLISGWSFPIALTQLEFRNPAAPALASTVEALIEIATGAPGSEVVIAQLPWTFRNVTAVGYLQGDPIDVALPEPILVPAGTRLSVRVSDSHTASLTYTGTKAMFREVAASGGTGGAADTVTVSDTAGRIGSLARTAADAVTLTDQAARSGSKARTAADTASLADAVTTGAVSRPRAATDSISTSDSAARSAVTISRAAADAATISDTATRVTSRARAAADSLTASDSVSRAATAVPRAAADAVTATDTATRSAAARTRGASDTVTATDTAARAALSWSRAAADSVVVTDIAAVDGQTLNITANAADTVSVSDTASRVLSSARTVSTSVTVSDQAARAAIARARSATDTAAVADVAAATTSRQRAAADVLAVSDVLAMAAAGSRGAGDGVSIADVAARQAAAAIRVAQDAWSVSDTTIVTRSVIPARVVLSDRAPILLTLSDRAAVTVVLTDRPATTDALSDRPLTGLVAADEPVTVLDLAEAP